jgi:hypothetical protein
MLIKRNTANDSEVNLLSAKMAKHSAARKGTETSVNTSALPISDPELVWEVKTSFQAEKLPVSNPATARLQNLQLARTPQGHVRVLSSSGGRGGRPKSKLSSIAFARASREVNAGRP